MKLPETLKIAGHTYKVIHERHQGMNKHCAGYYDEQGLRISIDPDQPGAKKAETLLHEVLHAVVREYNFPFPDEQTEEQAVTTISKGLYQVLRDNRLVFHD